MNKTFLKRSGLASGLTLIEVLVVVIVIAVLSMMAIPSLMSILPNFQARKAVEATSSLMYTARMTAANTQKPTRAVVDCRSTSKPCRMSVYTAIFNNNAELTGWTEVPDTARSVGINVNVSADTSTGVVPFSGNPANLYWAVFLPKGGVIASSQDPLRLIMKPTNKGKPVWTVSVDKTSGRVSAKAN